MGLKSKARAFAREYVIDLNGTKAAIRAGYSERSAYSQASRLLNNAEVQAEIQRARAEMEERTGISADKVLKELAKIGFSNIEDYFELDEFGNIRVNLGKATRDQLAAITHIETETRMEHDPDDERGRLRPVTRTKVRLADKHSALVSIGKHLGMFTDKQKADATVPMEALAAAAAAYAAAARRSR